MELASKVGCYEEVFASFHKAQTHTVSNWRQSYANEGIWEEASEEDIRRPSATSVYMHYARP